MINATKKDHMAVTEVADSKKIPVNVLPTVYTHS